MKEIDHVRYVLDSATFRFSSSKIQVIHFITSDSQFYLKMSTRTHIIHNLWYTYHLLGQAKLTLLVSQRTFGKQFIT